MDLVDVICIVFLFIWALMGFKRGVLFEILTVLIAVAAVVASYLLYPMLFDIAKRFVTIKDYNLSCIIILISFMMIMVILQMLTYRLIASWSVITETGFIFKLLGAAIAVPRGAFYLGILLWFIISLSPGSNLTKRINETIMTDRMKNVVVVVYKNVNNILRKEQISPFEMKGFNK